MRVFFLQGYLCQVYTRAIYFYDDSKSTNGNNRGVGSNGKYNRSINSNGDNRSVSSNNNSRSICKNDNNGDNNEDHNINNINNYNNSVMTIMKITMLIQNRNNINYSVTNNDNISAIVKMIIMMT